MNVAVRGGRWGNLCWGQGRRRFCPGVDQLGHLQPEGRNGVSGTSQRVHCVQPNCEVSQTVGQKGTGVGFTGEKCELTNRKGGVRPVNLSTGTGPGEDGWGRGTGRRANVRINVARHPIFEPRREVSKDVLERLKLCFQVWGKSAGLPSEFAHWAKAPKKRIFLPLLPSVVELCGNRQSPHTWQRTLKKTTFTYITKCAGTPRTLVKGSKNPKNFTSATKCAGTPRTLVRG